MTSFVSEQPLLENMCNTNTMPLIKYVLSTSIAQSLSYRITCSKQTQVLTTATMMIQTQENQYALSSTLKTRNPMDHILSH